MKKLNKILLEAISRGINLALDDIEDQNDIQQQSYGKIKDSNFAIEIVQNIYNKIKFDVTSLTKDDLKNIVDFYKIINLKYKITSSQKLKELIVHICTIDKNANLNWINTSYITNMKNLFAHTEFNGDISEWNVSHVRTMEGIFAHSDFNGNLSNWNTSRVENMSHMFELCSFTGENGDISNWKVFHVENMSHMFEICPYSGDISKWDTSALKITKYMFRSAPYFNCDISNWNVSNVCQSEYMFMNAEAFNQDLTKWDGKNLSITTFKASNISHWHLPKYWQDGNINRDGKVELR